MEGSRNFAVFCFEKHPAVSAVSYITGSGTQRQILATPLSRAACAVAAATAFLTRGSKAFGRI